MKQSPHHELRILLGQSALAGVIVVGTEVVSQLERLVQCDLFFANGEVCRLAPETGEKD